MFDSGFMGTVGGCDRNFLMPTQKQKEKWDCFGDDENERRERWRKFLQVLFFPLPPYSDNSGW